MMDVEPLTVDRNESVPVSERILVSDAVAAKLCSVSLPTLRKWVRDGVIHPVALPGGLRRKLYRRADLEAVAADREIGSTRDT